MRSWGWSTSPQAMQRRIILAVTATKPWKSTLVRSWRWTLKPVACAGISRLRTTTFGTMTFHHNRLWRTYRSMARCVKWSLSRPSGHRFLSSTGKPVSRLPRLRTCQRHRPIFRKNLPPRLSLFRWACRDLITNDSEKLTCGASRLLIMLPVAFSSSGCATRDP